MAVISKVKIKKNGTLVVGQFREGESDTTKFNVAGDFYTGELNETLEAGDPVKITKTNKTYAYQFVEE